MKSIVNFLALSLLFIAFSTPTFAQKKKGKVIDQAHVKYAVTAEGNTMVSAFTGSKIDLFFTPNNGKILGDLMSGMVKVDARFNKKDSKGMMLLDMMGQKKFIDMDDKLLEDAKKTNEKPEASTIEYTKKYKKIAGYKCQEARMMVEGMAEPVIVYITEKLNLSNFKDISMLKFSGLKGFPLSWEMEQDGMKFKIEATDVSLDKLPKKIFNLDIPEGYEKMTMEDLKGMGM